MMRKEGTEIILSSQEKSEFAQISEKLSGEAKSLFYLLVFFYPNPAIVAQSLGLLEGNVSILQNNLEKVVREINATLERTNSLYRVHGGKTTLHLMRGEERRFNFKSWVTFSDKEQLLLLSFLKGNGTLTKDMVKALNLKLRRLDMGSIVKNKKGRYQMIPTFPFTTPILLESLQQYMKFAQDLSSDMSKI